VPAVFFITHPDVVIDSGVPVPDWPLNERGQARMRAMTAQPWARVVRRIFASSERKARDAAQILAEGLGLGVYSVIANLGENDRSATGFLAKRRVRGDRRRVLRAAASHANMARCQPCELRATLSFLGQYVPRSGSSEPGPT
jgi:broad specificity phosphatase PhoE